MFLSPEKAAYLVQTERGITPPPDQIMKFDEGVLPIIHE